MKSAVTHKDYDAVSGVGVDYDTRLLKSLEGILFQEMTDNTWLCINGEHAGTVRYRGTEVHRSGLILNPVYELFEGSWLWILTGKPAPPACIKKY